MKASIPKTAWITCPYCNHINKVEIEYENEYTPIVMWCNSEEGGCDKVFALRITLKASYELWDMIPRVPEYVEVSEAQL